MCNAILNKLLYIEASSIFQGSNDNTSFPIAYYLNLYRGSMGNKKKIIVKFDLIFSRYLHFYDCDPQPDENPAAPGVAGPSSWQQPPWRNTVAMTSWLFTWFNGLCRSLYNPSRYFSIDKTMVRQAEQDIANIFPTSPANGASSSGWRPKQCQAMFYILTLFLARQTDVELPKYRML